MADLTSRIVVLVAVAFVAWVGLMLVFRRFHGAVAGALAALLSWALAGAFEGWLVRLLQHHRLWPLG
jgi:hypothetical protein